MRGCPRRRDKAGRENHGLDIFPQYPELFKFVGAGGFFSSDIQSLCLNSLPIVPPALGKFRNITSLHVLAILLFGTEDFFCKMVCH